MMDIKIFEDLKFKAHSAGIGGVQAVIAFDNGYGASVVRTPFTYGGRDGLYELAVLDKDGNITYETEITNDVIGYLEEDMVSELLIRIQQL